MRKKVINKQNDLWTLHRYFIWADRMRLHFDNTLKNKENLDEKRFSIDSFLYMSYWYGSLYVLIEGWQELGLQDNTVNSLLNSPNVDLLRRYRNGVFHFQKEYWDKRFLEFMTEGENCVAWVRQLTEVFSEYFLGNLLKIENA
jgi:hypothetical protein